MTKKQQEIFEKAYCNTKYPDIEERKRLEKATQLTEDRIQIWFQNRRAKDRRTADVVKSPSMDKIPDIINHEESSQEKDMTNCVNDEGGMDGELTKLDVATSADRGVGQEPSPKRMKLG